MSIPFTPGRQILVSEDELVLQATMPYPIDWISSPKPRQHMNYNDYLGLSIKVRDGIAHVVLQYVGDEDQTVRHHQHAELTRVWRDFERDDDVRAVLVASKGDEFYVSGKPPATFVPLSDDEARRFTLPAVNNGEMTAIVHEMIRFGKPVVAAVNGPAAGAGLTVVLLSDIAVMAEDAWLFDPHIMRGIGAGDGAGAMWPLFTGIAKAKLYLLTSDGISGAEAERIGLVGRAVPGDQVLTLATDYAARLAAAPPISMRFTKLGVNKWLKMAEVAVHDHTDTLEALSFFSGEYADQHTQWPPRIVP